jgi:hypothetical protein
MRIETKDVMNYNSNVRIIGLFLILLALNINASRQRVNISFKELPVSNSYVPFSVVVPTHIKGEFIRFIHPRSGKSAVAKIIKNEGDVFKVSTELASVIGVNKSRKVTVYAEEVY